MAFGIKNEVAREVVREVRKVVDKPLVIKLSPNAEDIVDMARVCEEEGADGSFFSKHIQSFSYRYK